MKKVKGIVLESNNKNVILLTHGGEYRQLPARGRLYPLGAEVEVGHALLPANLPVFAAAAAILLVMAFTLLWQTAAVRPSAYLALDINPSILLSLDKDGAVMETEALNNEGESLSKTLALIGLQAETALEIILQEASLRGYLAGGRQNFVFLTLAAPPGYGLVEEILQQSASQQLLSMEFDSYLKISATTPKAAREARENEVSLNALMLAEELAGKGLLPLAEGEEEQEHTVGGEGLNVQKLLEQVLPQHVFTEREFIAGDRPKENEGSPGPPDTPPGQIKEPGPPDFTPPGQAKRPEIPDFTPPGQDKETGPPVAPPGQEGKSGPPVSPPGQDKEHGQPGFTPPGQDKEPGPPHIPPGQINKPGPPETPPGQINKPKPPAKAGVNTNNSRK